MKTVMQYLKLIPIIFLLAACNTKTNEAANDVADQTKASEAKSNASEVAISDAWVREPAPGQKIGAAYMTLKSPQNSKLVYVEAIKTAGAVEIHSMSMNNGVMKMRMLDALTLEANKPQSLAPGGFHLMLFDLKKPLIAGEDVAFRLCFEGPNGNITHQNITLPIKPQ